MRINPKLPLRTKTFIIPGNPVPLKRVRFAKGRTYDSQIDIKEEYFCYILQQISKERNNLRDGPLRGLLDRPLCLHITFFMKIPKSNPKKIKVGQPHIYRPDLSNMIKLVEDVCTGILYKDDCLIAKCCAQKLYDDDPRTEFYLESIV